MRRSMGGKGDILLRSRDGIPGYIVHHLPRSAAWVEACLPSQRLGRASHPSVAAEGRAARDRVPDAIALGVEHRAVDQVDPVGAAFHRAGVEKGEGAEVGPPLQGWERGRPT